MEMHLFIIWKNGLYKKNEIIQDINDKLEIISIVEIEWSKDLFSSNLTRFYGENLPKNSGKEKCCGIGAFYCIIVKDHDPVYGLRETTKGLKSVNTNIFDLKKLYRSWTGSCGLIHATDNTYESNLQLALLFGKNKDIYMEKKTDIVSYKNDLVGAHGWKNFDDLFFILNLTTNYVILRNFYDLDKQLQSDHPDVDVLTDNRQLMIDVMNARKTSNDWYRVQHEVKIAGKNINFDIRYVGDNYYDSTWEYNILKNKIKFENFYIPDSENLFYSLLYHALIHKKNIAIDYYETLIRLSNDIGSKLDYKDLVDLNLIGELNNYMEIKEYSFVEPIDLTVFFNCKILSNKIVVRLSEQRRILNKKIEIRLFLRKIAMRILGKIKNVTHLL